MGDVWYYYHPRSLYYYTHSHGSKSWVRHAYSKDLHIPARVLKINDHHTKDHDHVILDANHHIADHNHIVLDKNNHHSYDHDHIVLDKNNHHSYDHGHVVLDKHNHHSYDHDHVVLDAGHSHHHGITVDHEHPHPHSHLRPVVVSTKQKIIAVAEVSNVPHGKKAVPVQVIHTHGDYSHVPKVDFYPKK